MINLSVHELCLLCPAYAGIQAILECDKHTGSVFSACFISHSACSSCFVAGIASQQETTK